MRFSDDFKQRVREASNLVDVIGQYVTLKRNGGNYQGLCPFHNERSPSFSVSEDKQVYHCFGCKAGGDIFDFVQNYQGLTFTEAIEYLAQRASLPLPAAPAENHRPKDQRTALYAVNALAARYYAENLRGLPAAHPARAYLATRGFDDAAISTYRLGYAGEAWEGLVQFLVREKGSLAAAEQVGLIKRRNSGGGHYDWFRERVIFPIFSPTEQCLGFGGRILVPGPTAKYVNSSESPVFHKGRVFYGLNNAVRSIRTEDEAIVVEGYMDWLALARVGITNAVATLGTALTEEHARLITRYTNRVLLLFDGDAAGRSAARRSLPILLAAGVHARGLFLPGDQDPDDFLKTRGVVELRQLIEGAPDLFDLVSTGAWGLAKGSPTAKIQLLDEFAPILRAAADPRLRRLYVENFANLLDVDRRLVEQSVTTPRETRAVVTPRKAASPEPGTDDAPAPAAEPPRPRLDLTKTPRAELDLLNLSLAREIHLRECLDRGVGAEFSHPGARQAFERIAELYRRHPEKFDSFSALLANEVHPAEMITRHLSEPYAGLANDAVAKLLQDCIKRVRETHLRSKSKELVSSLRGSGTAHSAAQLEQIMNIHKSRRSLRRDS